MRPLTMMTRCSGETLESMASASKTSWPPQSSSTLVLCLGGGSVLLKQPPLMLWNHAICICCIRSYDSQFSFRFHNGNPELLKRKEWRLGFEIRKLPGPGVAVRVGEEMAAIMWRKEAWARKNWDFWVRRFFFSFLVLLWKENLMRFGVCLESKRLFGSEGKGKEGFGDFEKS